MDQLRAILKLLDRRERWQLSLILLVMIPNALMQVAGIASVMPFIAVLAQPSLIEDNHLLASVYQGLEFTSANRFLMALAGAALLALLMSNALAALTTWLIVRFTYLRVHNLSNRLLSLYLHQEYEFFLARNPSDLTKNVINEVNQLVSGYIMPLLQMLVRGMVLLAIIALLVFADPVLALIVAILIGGAYSGIYLFFRKMIARLGENRLRANARRFKVTHEAFGAIKDLKVLGRIDYYTSAYHKASYQFAVNQSAQSLISQIPRYLLETIAFGMILVIALYLVVVGQSMQSAIPLISLYAMAGYRLMPVMQQIFQDVATLRFHTPVVQYLREEMLAKPVGGMSEASPDTLETAAETARLPLQQALELQGISYCYPRMTEPVLKQVSLTIPAYTTVAFVGESGAGKSTLVDIILGLLQPTAGAILVDGTPLTRRNLRAWQRDIGYVPQAIYLADDTLRRNIALGIPDRLIDDSSVERAARMASIHDFIVNDLPQGYETIAGDRGVRLSGGQRQRIGIARALYHNPDVLILDEATSALDGSTEAAVMDAIQNLSGQKTIVMIAHRLTTVRDCSRLYLLKRGELIGSGSFDELLEVSPEFQRMAAPLSSNSADEGFFA